MTKISTFATATALASLLLMGGAFAQTAAPAAKDAAPAAQAKAPKEAKPRSAASLDCSKQADEKGLKGKERKKFRKACIKEAGDKSAAPAAAPAATK
ncbi:PsiF family protein [Bradyrhizobium septentrionale]|uniref:Phosphate starvation-inducible protein PsiF n=1 Tax=Bradyrhizobium septentrionale TaxID=1404411 RepID=A0A973VUX5_9BRAD|nr:PsiF family protein [Bradyrhizobium septentrionale]UGY19625.1 PsiF family protein [Bradyrhizobium septentrionale]UGY28412.1 PsiF family protein [Bradyrhizobium septentrionale]